MRIIKIEIPLKFEVSSINSYLILEDPITIIDPGPYSKFHIEFLENKLKEYKLQLVDIKRILLTHGHTDHAGVAGFIQDKYNSEIFIHQFDKEKITGTIEEKIEKRKKFYAPLLIKDGFPKEIVDFLINFVGDFYKFVYKAEDTISIDEKKIIEFEHDNLKILHSPGHTAGHCCFYNEYLFFSGDIILKDTFVTPLLEFDETGERRKNLLSLVNTLDKVKRFISLNWYVAHGDNLFDKFKKIDEIKERIEYSLLKLKKIFDPKRSNYKNFLEFYKNPEKEKMLFYISFFYGLLDFLKS